MKLTLNETREKCKRKDNKLNNKLHWLSSKFSIYFSFFFLKLRLSADQVTIIFFLIGLIGALLFTFNSIILSVIAYIMFRLHIIIDMSDGDVARFNQSYSIRGAYWDAVIHSIVNPLYYVFISYSFYVQFNNDIFLILGAFSGISSSVLMAVKNNYYKAMLFNKISLEDKKNNHLKVKNFKFFILFTLSEIMSIEGFVLLTVLVRLIDIELLAFILVFAYIGFNILISLVKFYQFSYSGKTFTKS